MGIRSAAAALTAAIILAGCAGQSRTAQAPVWISSSINGLQQSACNCGGIEPKKDRDRRQKEKIRRQREAARQIEKDERN